jgi:hypothetical protein
MVGIISIGDIMGLPFLHKYTKLLEDTGTRYEVLFWNRENLKYKLPKNYLSYNLKSRYNKSPYYKIFDFIKYSLWIRKQLKKRSYSKLIILTTLSGLFIFDLLLKKFSNKYIFDIRDYSYEHINFFKFIEKMIIKKSFFTCISSEGFKEFLPQGYDYIVTHNFSKDEIDNSIEFKKKKTNAKINVTFIGAMRYFDHQVKIIEKLAKDPRFTLTYHGTGSEFEKYKEYLDEKKITNVKLTGRYNNTDKKKLLKYTDILNNSYITDKLIEIEYAISNKYYDGLIYKIPQLVETNTLKQKITEENEVGIGIDVDNDNFAEILYQYYYSINPDKFNMQCKKTLSRIIDEDNKYSRSILTFIKSK